MANKKECFVLQFDEADMNDVGLVGGKNTILGEIYQNLTPKDIWTEIKTISLNPDNVIKKILQIAKLEKRLK